MHCWLVVGNSQSQNAGVLCIKSSKCWVAKWWSRDAIVVSRDFPKLRLDKLTYCYYYYYGVLPPTIILFCMASLVQPERLSEIPDLSFVSTTGITLYPSSHIRYPPRFISSDCFPYQCKNWLCSYIQRSRVTSGPEFWYLRLPFFSIRAYWIFRFTLLRWHPQPSKPHQRLKGPLMRLKTLEGFSNKNNYIAGQAVERNGCVISWKGQKWQLPIQWVLKHSRLRVSGKTWRRYFWVGTLR